MENQTISFVKVVLTSFFAVCVYISIFITIYGNFKKYHFSSDSSNILKIGFRLRGVMWFLYAVGIVVFLKGGFESLLFFMPDDWMFRDIFSGNMSSVKSGLALNLALFASFYVVIKTGDVFVTKDKTDDLIIS